MEFRVSELGVSGFRVWSFWVSGFRARVKGSSGDQDLRVVLGYFSAVIGFKRRPAI